jgi:hypothetical protein
MSFPTLRSVKNFSARKKVRKMLEFHGEVEYPQYKRAHKGLEMDDIKKTANLISADQTTADEGEDVLDSRLQDYATKVSMICALEAGGKVPPLEAYRRIKAEWKRLKSLKREMFPKDNKTA